MANEIYITLWCILIGANLVSWLFLLKRSSPQGVLLSMKSLAEWKQSLSTFSKISLCLYFFLSIVQTLVMALTDSAAETYTLSLAVMMVYELAILSYMNYLLLGKRFPFKTVVIVLSAIIAISAISSIYYKSFQPINIADFWILIIKFLLAILGMSILVIRSSIYENKEAFFILSGFALMSVLHMFASGLQLLDYRGEWDFIQIIEILILGYWLGSSLWLRKLSSP